ncbi:MAG TPA: hypothetical protein VKR58_03665 [Aquella sp.]|nr:hypothetical protein [Aquella sp.]
MVPIDPFVFITKRGHKQIKNKDGYVLMTYKNIPRSIKFNHRAVNDYNQHLCGGWSVYNHPDFDEIDRVEQGLKPVGISHSSNLEKVTIKIKNLINKGFLASYTTQIFNKKLMYNVTASVTGKLCDYFDMKTLANDYENNGINSDDITEYKNVDFSAFHNDKYDHHPIEITGLILGYPIENTIALIKQS